MDSEKAARVPDHVPQVLISQHICNTQGSVIVCVN